MPELPGSGRATISSSRCCGHDGLNRREFLSGVGTTALGGVLGASLLDGTNQPPALRLWPPRPAFARGCSGSTARSATDDTTLRMQPVLLYSVPERTEGTSWRLWGGLASSADADDEVRRIEDEMATVRARAEFPLELMPVRAVSDQSSAGSLAAGAHDGLIVFAAGCSEPVLRAATPPDRWNLIFCRHRTGPAYLWYEIVHPTFLRRSVDEFAPTGMTVDDVVIDDLDELVWRLRALHGLKCTIGKRIVTVGGPGGWGTAGASAPEEAHQRWGLEYTDLSYSELADRLAAAFADPAMVSRCETAATRYLRSISSIATDREFVDRAFVLAEVLRDVMVDAATDTITLNNCMGTIMDVARTTACLPLSLLNDDGYLAFCESDFVVIPSGILLHGVSGQPVFMNDPTYPHQGEVTLAHCSSPRRMDGQTREPARLLTHFESDYGAAPRVEMRIGQVTTNLIPDFAGSRWLGFRGTIARRPTLDICRTQIDLEIDGDWRRLLSEMGGFHWMTCYGDHLREVGYALGKVGIEWHDLSAASSEWA